MSGQNSDQLHRTTLTIYTSIMEQFNPSLQRLVALGNSYIQAFQALAVTSEAYFSALSKMGEQAMQSMSSSLLGKCGDLILRFEKNIREHYALFFVFNMTNFYPFISGPSPQPSRSTSVSGLAGGRVMRALVPHPPSANSTLLPFSREETITLFIKEARNGWLFGRSDSSGRQGWFPAAYVGPMDEPPGPPDSSSSSFRRSSSMSNLLNQPVSRSQQTAPTVPPPPPPAPSTRSSNSRPVFVFNIIFFFSPSFYRGTNPFATVKLKPTKTNDRSAPRI
uniref:BAR/IMD domain containing adaptor protein 2 like 2a n=1 Tax=Sinocyclocheilus anshuiensis TaxID=1608454 RepID=A0A671PEA2_9TELE